MQKSVVTIKIRNSLCRLVTTRSRSLRGVSHQLNFMGDSLEKGMGSVSVDKLGKVGRCEVPSFT